MRSIRVKGVPVLLPDTLTSRYLKDAVSRIFKSYGFYIWREFIFNHREYCRKQEIFKRQA